MNNNQATLQKMERMGMWGMMQRFRACMEAGEKADLTPDELVSMLVEAEWDERQNRRLSRLLKLARFRYRAGLEDIDFALKRNLQKNLLMRLADCQWVEHHQDLILTGPCGSGKSFIASALGQQACMYGHSVAYWPAAKLFEQLKLCKADGSYLREMGKLARKHVVIVDDFGLEILDTASRLFLLELLEDRHGRASTLVASQLPVSQWHQVIGEAKTTQCHTSRSSDPCHDHRPDPSPVW